MPALDVDDVIETYAPPELALEFQPVLDPPVRRTWREHRHGAVKPGAFQTLISFHYFRNTDLDKLAGDFPQGAQFIADCGAFSAMTQGVDIGIPEYAAWIRRWSDHLVAYSSMDVIGDPAASARNLAEMEDMGLTPFPVFHLGEHFDYLEAYCAQYRYVALGGMAGTGFEFIKTWIAKCFRIARTYGTVLHGFGQTRMETLKLFPWYSADSSSWGKGHRFGVCHLWSDELESFVNLPGAFGVPDVLAPHHDLIALNGVDPLDLTDPDRFHYTHAARCNAASWYRFGRWLRAHHGPQPHSTPGEPVGLNLYLVDGSTDNLVTAAKHIHEVYGGTP